MAVSIPVSWGEIIDKITILEIKNERLKDAAKVANVRKELELLVAIRDRHFAEHRELARLALELKRINSALWEIEDEIRSCERAKDFGPRFVELARSIYLNNDRRAELKREINVMLGSDLVEEKSYAPY